MQTQTKSVTVYSTPTCSWCSRAKSYLGSKGVRYKDIDVSRDADAAQDLVRRTGQMGVPVIMIGSKTIVGFDQSAINRELGIH